MVTAPTPGPVQGFKPAFVRVQQEDDFDDAFACIATVTGKTLADVRKVAIDEFKHPKNGPYWITEDLICKLFAHFGWVATNYKESSGVASLPDLCLLWVGCNPDNPEIGRHAVFHRIKAAGGKQGGEDYAYVIDPAYWVSESQHVRDAKAFPATWYIGLHPMNKPAPQGK